ncbi:MAG: aldolase catalytic domain-containing protein [Dehalococcoidales bacterium]|nr:aldolase catalytic domain-containing protein [Dehalococcoidales bacterium]
MTETNSEESAMARWVSYRPEIKVLDCTIRDGGLMNDHVFDDQVVRAVYQACVDAGVDYMEIGYKDSRRLYSPSQFGPWKYCSEDDIRRIVGDNDTPLKLSAMADAEKSDYHEDILPREQSVLDMIRVATYIHQIPLALDMIKDAHDKGYETTVNLMAVSTAIERELDEALELLANSEVDTIYIVDSFGALYSEQVHYLADKYLKYAKAHGKRIGMHAHNNLQLAFASTIEAIIKGADMLDASMAGLGRGAGNCPIELLVGFLHNPKLRIRPILKCVQESIEPLRGKLKWGFDTSYMLTGFLNKHPLAAMNFNDGSDRGDIVKFYDMISEEE